MQPVPAPLLRVSWSGLQMGEALGEGASGRIIRVQEVSSGESWALKLFKGSVTSDGLPEHERVASRVAGRHPALCTPVAELSDHPQGTPGLLLPLIPNGHVPLAAPPSMDSCTRDMYAAGWHINVAQALRLTQAIVAAVAHLHRRGVMHGDLYAHNILWNPQSGDALLSDFGAATLLSADRPDQRRALLALEVRALGCLFEELVLHAQGDTFHTPFWAALGGLAQVCQLSDPAQRPTLDEVVDELGRMAQDRGGANRR